MAIQATIEYWGMVENKRPAFLRMTLVAQIVDGKLFQQRVRHAAMWIMAVATRHLALEQRHMRSLTGNGGPLDELLIRTLEVRFKPFVFDLNVEQSLPVHNLVLGDLQIRFLPCRENPRLTIGGCHKLYHREYAIHGSGASTLYGLLLSARIDYANRQLFELFIRYRAGGVEQGIHRSLCFREGDYLSDVVLSRKQHHDSVQS